MDTTTAPTTVKHRIEARLIEQGAHQGTIDAYGSEVIRLFSIAMARSLREVAGSGDYSLGGIDPEIMERIAVEIEQYGA